MDKQWIGVVDLGTAKTCAIVAEVGDDKQATVVGVGVMPTMGMYRGAVVDMDLVGESIRKAMDEAMVMSATHVDGICVSVSGNHIRSEVAYGSIFLDGNAPEVTDADIDRVLQSAKKTVNALDEQVLHIIPNEFALDGAVGMRNPLGMTGKRLEVKANLVFGRTSLLQNLLKSIERAKFQATGLVVQAVAVGEVVLTRKEKEDGIIVIDVGAGTTDIGVYGGGSLVHTSVIPMGGSDLTRDISLGLKLSLDEAEKLKLDYGTLFRSVTDQAPPIILKVMGGQETRKISVSTVTDIIEARVQEIIDQCKDQLLKAELGEIIPKAIVLTGGSSHLKGFPEYLARTMRVPVQIGMPHLPNGCIQGLDNPESAAAVGLLRYGIRQRFHVSKPLVRSDELNPGNGNFLSKIRRMWQDFLH